MTTSQREREATFEGTGRFDSQDFRRLPAVAHVREEAPEELDAIYYDTADLRLLTHGVTLRRRSGGHDAGWHVKLPAGGPDRTEVHAPLAAGKAGAVPGELLRRTAAYARGGELLPVAHLRTHRRRYLLLDKRERCLAEVAQDAVAAQTLDSRPAADTVAAARSAASTEEPVADVERNGGRTLIAQWSEVEVELADGGPELLAAATRSLETAGWHLSPSAHKLDHALADALAARRAEHGSTEPEERQPLPAGSAGEAVMRRLRAQVRVLVRTDAGARADQPEAVHSMRSAARRLRNLLRGQRRLLDRSRTEPVVRELRWLTGLLADTRDHEVLAERLPEQAAELRRTDPAVRRALKGLAGRIREQERARHDTAWRAAVRELDGPRYFALLDALEGLLADPPLRDRARKPAVKQLRKAAEGDSRRLRERLAAAEAAPEGEERETALHSLRKAARRARHTAETARPYAGKPARRLRDRTKALQQLLGGHQDAAVARHEISVLAREARETGEDTFGYGLLYAHQTRTLDTARSRLPHTARAATDRRLTHWR